MANRMTMQSQLKEHIFGPVFPVLPSYTNTGQLDLEHVSNYLCMLASNGAKTVMTTAGTSQFNLLSTDEILELNRLTARTFNGRVICGLPTLAERQLAPLIVEAASNIPGAPIMLTYPERFYSESGLIGFFERMTKLAPETQFYLHGLPMRLSNGGVKDYDAKLVSTLTASVPNIAGMKEESSTYESGFKLCSEMQNVSDFEFIVAGGSMRRFLLLYAAGAQSFLSGVGSLFPKIETAFHDAVTAGDLKAASALIRDFETPLFQVFMDIGWHPALRRAAQKLGYISASEREPMTCLTQTHKRQVDGALARLHKQLQATL